MSCKIEIDIDDFIKDLDDKIYYRDLYENEFFKTPNLLSHETIPKFIDWYKMTKRDEKINEILK